jgi:hypothetical protein
LKKSNVCLAQKRHFSIPPTIGPNTNRRAGSMIAGDEKLNNTSSDGCGQDDIAGPGAASVE